MWVTWIPNDQEIYLNTEIFRQCCAFYPWWACSHLSMTGARILASNLGIVFAIDDAIWKRMEDGSVSGRYCIPYVRYRIFVHLLSCIRSGGNKEISGFPKNFPKNFPRNHEFYGGGNLGFWEFSRRRFWLHLISNLQLLYQKFIKCTLYSNPWSHIPIKFIATHLQEEREGL